MKIYQYSLFDFLFDVSIIFLLLYLDYSRVIADMHICTYLKANVPAVLGQKYIFKYTWVFLIAIAALSPTPNLHVLWHVGSSWTRGQTHVPCIGRLIPCFPDFHCTPGKSLITFIILERKLLGIRITHTFIAYLCVQQLWVMHSVIWVTESR